MAGWCTFRTALRMQLSVTLATRWCVLLFYRSAYPNICCTHPFLCVSSFVFYAHCRQTTPRLRVIVPWQNNQLAAPPFLCRLLPHTHWHQGRIEYQAPRKNYDATIVYIDRCLTSRSYPTFLNLIEMHVTGDHLGHYLECTWNYIAITRFVWGKDRVTGEDKVLGKPTKLKHFDRVKAVFKQMLRR